MELYLFFPMKICRRWFSGSWRILANDFGEKILHLLTCCFISCPNCTTAWFQYSTVLPSSSVGWLFNGCFYGNQKCTRLILTVLAESAHEPWRTVAWPVVFITQASVLTNRAGFCAACTPETLRTHCKKKKKAWYSHFYHCYHVKFVRLFCT